MKMYFSYRHFFDYLTASLASVIFYKFANFIVLGFRWPADADRVAFASAIMGVAASLLGLVLAASTFLVGHVQNDRFKILREARSWNQFPSLVKSCLWRLLALTVVSGISGLTEKSSFQDIATLLVFLIVLSIMALSALVWVTGAIISIRQ